MAVATKKQTNGTTWRQLRIDLERLLENVQKAAKDCGGDEGHVDEVLEGLESATNGMILLADHELVTA